MTKAKPNSEASSNHVLLDSPIPKVTGIIVTKADKAVWAECSNRLLFDPRDKRLRYFHLGSHGITAVFKSGGEKTGEWFYPAPKPMP